MSSGTSIGIGSFFERSIMTRIVESEERVSRKSGQAVTQSVKGSVQVALCLSADLHPTSEDHASTAKAHQSSPNSQPAQLHRTELVSAMK